MQNKQERGEAQERKEAKKIDEMSLNEINNQNGENKDLSISKSKQERIYYRDGYTDTSADYYKSPTPVYEYPQTFETDYYQKDPVYYDSGMYATNSFYGQCL